MSIRSTVGNFAFNVQDNISSVLTTTRSQIENIVGSTTTALSNVWSGGFVGMSQSGMDDLKTKLTDYCDGLQLAIDGFDQNGDITSALQGEVQTAAYDFIAAVKELLQAYVSTLKQEIAEADQAYNNFMSSGKSISQDVENAASDIRSNASQISLD